MICVTLEDGEKRLFSEKIIFGIKELPAADKVQHLLCHAVLLTKILTPKGPAAFLVREPFDYLSTRITGIEGTDNDGNRLSIAEENIIQITETSLQERQGNILCASCVRTNIQQPTGLIIFYVQETVEHIASRKQSPHQNYKLN